MGQLVSAITSRHGKHQTILVETDRVVGKIAAEHSRVATASTIDGVVACTTCNIIITGCCINGVISGIAIDNVIRCSCSNIIVS